MPGCFHCIKICIENKTVIRIGINHGSLSDRIMTRYGNTPAGMVQSALEFINIFRSENFGESCAFHEIFRHSCDD